MSATTQTEAQRAILAVGGQIGQSAAMLTGEQLVEAIWIKFEPILGTMPSQSPRFASTDVAEEMSMSEAARFLKIADNTLRKRLKEHRIKPCGKRGARDVFKTSDLRRIKPNP